MKIFFNGDQGLGFRVRGLRMEAWVETEAASESEEKGEGLANSVTAAGRGNAGLTDYFPFNRIYRSAF